MPKSPSPPADLTGHTRRNWIVVGPVDGFRALWLCHCTECGVETRTYPTSRLVGHGGRLHKCAASVDKPERNPRNVDLSGQPITWADLGDPCV